MNAVKKLLAEKTGMTAVKAGVVLCCLLMFAACGYRFAAEGETIDNSIRKVFVAAFDNKTSEANIENTFRTAFADQFIQGRRFVLTNSPDEADAIFSGSIESLSAAVISYQATNIAAEDRMMVVIALSFEARNPHKILWKHSGFAGNQDYALSNNPSISQTNKKNALVKLANDTAERAYRLMMSGF